MLGQFVTLCLFKSKPQDLPASSQLLLVCVVATFATNLLGNAYYLEQQVALFSLSETVLLGVAIWLLLQIFNLKERWTQTAIAVYGASTLLSILSLPFFGLLTQNAEREAMSTPLAMVLLIEFWFYAILVFILKEALDSSLSLAITITLVVVLGLIITLMALFGTQLS